MTITNNIISIKSQNSIISVGSFDGVHLAHKKIIDFMNATKLKYELSSLIYTFDNHPSTLFSDTPVKLLTTNAERKLLFEEQNIDIVFFQNFDRKFASLKAENFVKEYLIDKLNMSFLVIGDDHRFGNSRQGNYDHLSQLAKKYSFGLHKISSVFVDDLRVSSTNIRNFIVSGEIEKANKMLGYEYFVATDVIGGDKIGRKIGFPTANLNLSKEKLLPQNGVYAVKILFNNREYKAMCNVGFRPTLNKSDNVTVEVNIFDFNRNIYNKRIKVCFLKKIRNELFFNSKDELINQLFNDKDTVLNFFDNKNNYKKAANN